MASNKRKVVCIKTGNKYSPEYVNVLQSMLLRHLKLDHELICITDDPTGVNCKTVEPEGESEGWWTKLTLFRENAYNLTEKFLYLDLDTIIVSNIDNFFDAQENLIIIDDFLLPMWNSSVMLIEPNTNTQIWEKYDEDREAARKQAPNGDQDWITQNAKGVALWPKRWCASYRVQAKFAPPAGTKIVVFHGKPDPHEVKTGWVSSKWW